MGIVHVHRGRLAPALVLAAFILLAVGTIGLAAQRASAIGEYGHGGATCGSCHTGTPRTKDNAANSKCVTCHTGYAVPSAGTTCWTCHTPGQDVQPIKTGAPTSCTTTCHLANGTDHQHNPHPERGTCTTCHNVTTNATTANGSPHHTAEQTPPPVVVTTKLTAKVAPATVTVGKKVKVTGTAGPASSLASAKVAFKVERKVGTKWVKMKTGTAVAGATGAFTWSYKATKKGAHHVIVSIAKTSTHTAKAVTKTFKVK